MSTDSCGASHYASNDNLWTQSAATGTDCHGQSYIADVSNWNLPTYPDGPNFNVTINQTSRPDGVHLNESVSMGNLTINLNGLLVLDANNSGGGGAHSITVAVNGGTITNNGALTSIGPVEAGQTYQFNVATLLTGAGTTRFGYGTLLNGPGALTVGAQQSVISGGNAIFNTSLVNQGIINADGSSAFFDHRELTFANPQITNTGTIETTAGGLIQFLASTVVNNAGGTLSASGDFSFFLSNGVSINGGTLLSTGVRASGNFFQVGNATLSGVTLATGTEMAVDGGILTLNGVITNNGEIIFANTQNPAGTGRFNIASSTTLSGTGKIIINGAPNTIATGKTLTLGAGQDLEAGFTSITGAIVNHGLINAVSDRGLTLTGGNITNDGTMQASGGGFLILTSDANGAYTINNAGGLIQAIDSAQLLFQGQTTVQNGTINSAATATAQTNGLLTLQNVTTSGLFHLTRTCFGTTTLTLSGTLTNNGTIDDLVGECNPVNIHLLGNVTLGGTGNFVLFRSTLIDGSSGAILTNGAGHTIGAGDSTTITTSVVNNGFLGSGGANQFNLNGANLTNNGTLNVGDTSTMAVTSTFTQLAGTIDLGDQGTLNSAQDVHLKGGSLVGNGTINGNVFNDAGVVGPGHSPGSIRINGNYTQGSSGSLNMEIGGTAPGTGYDQLTVSGNVTLAGALTVTVINGFKPAVGDVYTLVAGGSFSGSFSTINLNGLTGQIDYSSNGVTLTVGTAAPQLLNISTRLKVLTGDNVLIGGFIITGSESKNVIIRAIGPSLTKAGVTGALGDPVLELHKPDGTIVTNDNWKAAQEAAIIATGVAPTNDLESAIVATLAPGNYTAIVRGKDNGTGIGLVEAYDLNPAASSDLANISTRGFVDTGDNVMIGGFIIGGGSTGTATQVLVRAIGPSLTAAGVAGALQDPTLELHDANGSLLKRNDNWKDTQEAAIQATGVAPTNDKESAILDTLAPGNYTAIVRGVNSGTGVGLVEVYNLK